MRMRAAAAVSALAVGWRRLGQKGAVAILFAVAAVPMMICTAVAVDFSQMAAMRSALQRAADAAALSGAAVYTAYTQGDTFNALARNVAKSAFCNATTTLPASAVMAATSGSTACGSLQGPAVTATIAGAKVGTKGAITNAGCSSTKTVVANATCGFVVTVSATATTSSVFFTALGSSHTISVTASAMNPFINIANALSSTLSGGAWNANSIWVYPVLLDANGSPATTPSNPGALPDASACTGDPTQTSCGAYSMLASTNYANCPTQTVPACTVNGTKFGPGGAVQNPAAGAAVITATTPLGIAFESTSGGGYTQSTGKHTNYGYDNPGGWGSGSPPYMAPSDDCVWPFHTMYNTVSQAYTPADNPVYPWSKVTSWFYSSYLVQNLPPSQGLIVAQNTQQVVKATPQVANGVNTPAACTKPAPAGNYQRYYTSYPTSGSTNCSLYIVRDPASLTPDSAYVGSCFSPSNTPGQNYAILSCQSFSGHKFAFFWNDMGGANYDDKDYGNGTLTINCTGQPRVILIN